MGVTECTSFHKATMVINGGACCKGKAANSNKGNLVKILKFWIKQWRIILIGDKINYSNHKS